MMMADTATGSFQLRMLITQFSIPGVWKIGPGIFFHIASGRLRIHQHRNKVNIHRRAELLLGLFTSTRFHPFFNGTMEGSRKW